MLNRLLRANSDYSILLPWLLEEGPFLFFLRNRSIKEVAITLSPGLEIRDKAAQQIELSLLVPKVSRR